MFWDLWILLQLSTLDFCSFFFFGGWGHCLITVGVEVQVFHSASTNTGWEGLECLVTVSHVTTTDTMGAEGGLITAKQWWKAWVSVRPPLALLQQGWVRVPLYCWVGVKVEALHLAFANMDGSGTSVFLQWLAGLEQLLSRNVFLGCPISSLLARKSRL